MRTPAVFLFIPVLAFLSDLTGFLPFGGITYYPGNKSALKRKFQKNYFFLQKLKKKFWKLKKRMYLCIRIQV